MTTGQTIPEAPESETLGTVIVALLMNLAIAVSKAVAGLLSGSAAMLSEAAHSVADTMTEVFLYIALRRGSRGPNERHPFGYGREAYFWAFMAATFTFIVGGGFSITHGFNEITADEPPGDYLVSYIVLAISFGLESVSLAKGLKQTLSESRRLKVSPWTFLKLTPDTSVKAVVLEDIAALAGLVIAGAGLGLTELTGSPVYDGVASMVIGVLLLVVAVVLAAANKSLLIGQSVPPRMRDLITEELLAVPTIKHVRELYTIHLGPSQIFVAAKVDFADTASGASIEDDSDSAERRLRQRFPQISFVFLDPTPDPPSRDS
ncbi:cation diffusion facilitator family transporter [Stackebrandtia nassauensis]|uniref:Cation diffusion facilitator family transporter n=1 Tax=Stackebrandtia nassauensis (strain DSM 44728 / CIP 108903 / NRRL B-16338 / NBRC 102104 / LLR-40K-21) TaxID=446470 RepID=D3Q294_STANL|nr:cation diffusion facilitator family transporter [Stackebrandtia nassauensis]ADD43827.1 cation diffusion facilitator family transporter [Stackebrandtia nassauensis DSM 44728]